MVHDRVSLLPWLLDLDKKAHFFFSTWMHLIFFLYSFWAAFWRPKNEMDK